MVQGAVEGFVVSHTASGNDASAAAAADEEYVYGPKELVATAFALARFVISALNQPWFNTLLPPPPPPCI